MPERPFERRSQAAPFAPKTRRIAAASEASDCGVPLPCADDHPDVCRADIRRRRAPARSRARARRRRRGSRADPAHRSPSRRREPRPVTVAPRARAEASVSSTSAPAPSPNRLPSCRASNGRIVSFASRPTSLVVEHHLRLDRRIVADRDRAVGLAVAQRLHRLDHRQRAADAVVGDAGVRALEAVPDADVSEHVVRQRAQQPHRIDGVRELAPERRQRRPAPRSAAGSSRTGSRSCRRPSRRRRRCDRCTSPPRLRRACRDTRRGPEASIAAIRGVEAEQIGAPDQLVQLAVLDHRARIEIGDLAGDTRRPAGRVPLRDRRDRRAPARTAVEDLPRALPGGADRAGAGDDDCRGLRHRSSGRGPRPSTSSRMAQHDAAVRAAEAEGIRHCDADALTPRSAADEIQIAIGVALAQIRVDRHLAVADRERADGDLDRAGRGDQMSHRALGRAHRDILGARRRRPRASRRSRCCRSWRSTCRAR